MLFRDIFSWLFIGLVLFITLSAGYPTDSQDNQQGQGTADDNDDTGVGLTVLQVKGFACPKYQHWVKGRCRVVSRG
jgi:hypothetical protein